MKQIIKDVNFKNGFMLNHVDALVTRDIIKVINYMSTVQAQPSWKVAQWCCKHNLANGTEKITMDHAYIYQDEGKSLKVYPNKGKIALELNASNEYTMPRRDGDDWPHLLLEQDFDEKLVVSHLKECQLEIDFTINKFKDYMYQSKTDIHTAQFQWFIAVSNQNKQSKGFGDFLWFGLSFFDYPRYEIPPGYRAKDGGKEENTGKYIHIIEGEHYLKKPIKLNEATKVKLDILPFINDAIHCAFKEGYLRDTGIEDLVIHNMNIGWEVTGTFDVGLDIDKLSLIAKERS